jgi:uncharacterized RDD family membrane protein YckC
MTRPARREYAGIVSRTAAYLLDALIVTVLVIGAVVVLVLIAAVVAGAPTRDVARAAVPVSMLVLPAVLAVYQGVFWVLAGRTPGMALFGIRVVAGHGRPLSWPASLVRAVVLTCFPVGALWSLVDRRSQGVHDKLARTTVVRSAPARVREADEATPTARRDAPTDARDPARH